MFVAWREIRFARGRFTTIAAVVGLITVLVGFLSGLTGGLAGQNVSAVLSWPADRIVLSESTGPTGAEPTFADSSVTDAQQDAWAATPGITDVHPVGISQLRATTPAGASTAVAVLGVDGGWLPTSPVAADTVTLSTPAAKALGVEVGGVVDVAGRPFTVTAVGGDDWYSHTPVVQVIRSDWSALSARAGGTPAAGTALVVSGSPAGGDWAAVDSATGTTSVSPLGAVTAIPAFTSEIGSLAMIVGLLFGISALVVGAFFTVWATQRRPDVAVLKALGASTGALVRDTAGQALVVLVVGVGLGLALVTGAGIALQGTSLPFLLSPFTTVLPGVALILVGLLGAGFALRAVLSVDPLTALGSNR